MTGFLASVTSIDEAALVLDAADIIDLKNPAQGALGALPHRVVENIARFVDGRKPVSATVGDLPMEQGVLLEAVKAMADTGVDIVKIGFFGHESQSVCARALGALTDHCKLVAVLFADQQPELKLLDTLAEAGFYGAMLDTADKAGGSLTRWMDVQYLRTFIEMANSRKLLTGLAGSLRQEDISGLAEMKPDYLGFRGALCFEYARQAVMQPVQVAKIASLLRECNIRAMPAMV